MLYYEVAVLGASLKPLTYSSNFKISAYQIVSVPIKSSVKSAVILREVAKPSFKTKEILEILQLKFSPFQIALANCIAHYYAKRALHSEFSSLRARRRRILQILLLSRIVPQSKLLLVSKI